MRLILERRILAYVAMMMGGVAFATSQRDMLASPAIVGTTAMALLLVAVFGLRPAGGRMAQWQPVMVDIAWCLVGILSSLFHISQLPPGLDDRAARVEVTGMVEYVDGRFDQRLRMWLSVSKTERGPADVATRIGGIFVRLSVRPDKMAPQARWDGAGGRAHLSAARPCPAWCAGLFASCPRRPNCRHHDNTCRRHRGGVADW